MTKTKKKPAVVPVQTERVIDLNDESPMADRALRLEKLEKISKKMAKLYEAEKRWLRKLRLATTKLGSIRGSLNRYEKQRKALS